MTINEQQLDDYILSKRIMSFFHSGTKKEKDFAMIALSYHQAKCTNDFIKVGRSVTARDLETLTIFKDIQTKYGFDYLADVTEEEKEIASNELLMDGIFVENITKKEKKNVHQK
jgi:hypothetical protein